MAWKKLGSNKKISRMVSDLQSPKMADSSLVVATGFPTSLVDLFVKNRARLRRPRNKKRGKTRPEQEEHEDSLVISDPVVVSCSRGVRPCENNEEEVEVDSLREEELKVESFSEDANLGKESCGGNGRKVRLGGLFRVVLVLGLGLSVKKMVVGVTLSAFALIILDCCWESLWLLFEPFLGLVRRVLGSVWWLGREKGEEEVNVVVGLGGDSLVCDGDVQIQAVECDDEEVMGEELETDLVWCEERVLECEKGQSKGGKIRRKLVKNLVPKKLRSSAKKRKLKRKMKELALENEALDRPGDSRGNMQVSHDYEGDVDEKESSRKGSLFKDDHVTGSSSFTRQLQSDKGMSPVDEETRIPGIGSRRNYGYGIVMLVLAGLVGGRIAAFLLTVGLFLVMKLVNRWR